VDSLKRLPQEISIHIDHSPQELQEIFSSYFSRIFDNKKEILFGFSFGFAYLIILSLRLFTGSYSYHFFLNRLVSVIGIFIMGILLYQGIVIMKIFVVDVQLLKLRSSALFSGLHPVSSLATKGVFCWLTSITIITLPALVLGINPSFLYWYITIYVCLYLFGLILLFFLMYGFHQNMKKLKNEMLIPLTPSVNTCFSRLYFKNEFSKTDVIEQWLPLVEAYRLIATIRDWPISFKTVRDVILTYIIPIIFTLFGISL
jgi:hypothetical protein